MSLRSVWILLRAFAASDLISHSFYKLAMAAIYIPVLLNLREALFLSVPPINYLQMLGLMCLQRASHSHDHHYHHIPLCSTLHRLAVSLEARVWLVNVS